MNISEKELALISESGLSSARISRALDDAGIGDVSLIVSYETESTNKDARDYYESLGKGRAVFIASSTTPTTATSSGSVTGLRCARTTPPGKAYRASQIS